MGTPQYEPFLKEDYIESVSNQLKSGWIGPSKTTVEFEEKICEVTGSRYCVSTTSGTTALLMGICALELPKNSTILFPSYTFIAGANAARFLGFNIELVDIKRSTMSMNPDLVELDKNVSAIMFVNHNSYCGEDVQKIKELCRKNNIPLIEDSSQALGIKNAGRTGDFGVFSFSVPKIVTTGQGGALITDNEEIYTKCKRLRDHGDDWRKSRIHNFLGINLKFNDVLASLGLAQLNQLDELLYQRKEIWDWYKEHIDIVDFGYPSTWMVIHENKNSDKIIQKLKENDIQAVKYYLPINRNVPYEDSKIHKEAEYVSENFIYLPSSLTLTREKVKLICDTILNI